MVETHFEEFIGLADVTADAALLAWGGFWFRRDEPDRPWHVVPDHALAELGVQRTHTVGDRSEPYEAHTAAWAAQGHLLHASLAGDRLLVTPIRGLDQDGRLTPLHPQTPAGEPVEPAFTVYPAQR